MFSNFRHTAWFQGLAKRGVSLVEARDEGTAEVIVEVEEGVEKKRIGGETF